MDLRHITFEENVFRRDSPLWATFIGHPGAPEEGDRRVVPVLDLSHTPFICAGTGEPYLHFVRRGDGQERIFDYAGECAQIEGEHAHPGSRHGHQ